MVSRNVVTRKNLKSFYVSEREREKERERDRLILH